MLSQVRIRTTQFPLNSGKDKHVGAEEACLAHNQEVVGSKPTRANWG